MAALGMVVGASRATFTEDHPSVVEIKNLNR